MPPSGGPADTTPPFVVETRPGKQASSVPRDAGFELTFSETIDCRTVERNITFLPEAAFGEIECSGATFSAEFADSLLENQTYVVTVEPGVQDDHGVRSRDSYVLAFSTGDSLDQGIIQGEVVEDTLKIIGAIVWASRSPAVMDSAGIVRDWDYMTTSGEDGVFILEYLEPGGYYLAAFLDRNSNGRFETESERGVLLGEPYTIKSRRDLIEDVVIAVPAYEEDEAQRE
jgi:hypothetical protein